MISDIPLVLGEEHVRTGAQMAHPIVDNNTVEQVVGLVVCTNHLWYFSTDEWVDQTSQYPRVASLKHLYTLECMVDGN